MNTEEEIQAGAKLVYDCLKRALQRKSGCLLGRNGTIELQALLTFQKNIMGISPEIASKLELHAGVFPSTRESVNRWAKEYMNSLSLIQQDPVVGGWYAPTRELEIQMLSKVVPRSSQIPLRSLEPYYVEPEKRWTNLLNGKRVCVVSSFTETAHSQIFQRRQIWGAEADSLLPPETEWVFVQTGYAPILAHGRAEWPVDCDGWEDAVTYMEKKISEHRPDVCIIGCGGLGMILGARCKKMGIATIVLGGATQVLFGIKGNRWASHSVISKFWNDAWVWPSAQETPRGAAQIEGACYWGADKN
jgi:hypothetical protein